MALDRAPAGSLPSPRLVAALAVCFFLSGAAGLAYEVVWTRMLILVFGATSFAISTVLTSFMAGLALGGILAGRYARRLKNPARIYGILEIGIGLYAMAVPWIFDALVPVFKLAWTQLHVSFHAFSLVRFVLAGSVLVIPTVLMGATLPLLSDLLARRPEGRGFKVGLLYALNTGGAVTGALVAGFVLLPGTGMKATIGIAAAVNIVLGASVVVLSRGLNRDPEPKAPPGAVPVTGGGAGPAPAPPLEGPLPAPPAGSAPAPPAPGARLVLALIFLSGFVAMTYEVAWSRVLHLMIGSSVYAFTVILATFLTGLALGALIAAPVIRRWREGEGLAAFGIVQGAVAAGVFLTLLYFSELPYLYAEIMHALRDASGAFRYGDLTFVQFLISGLVMLVPAGLLGAAFPLAVQVRAGGGERTGALVGRVYAFNTLGAILGSFAGGFVLLPALGIQATLLLGLGANAALGTTALAAAAARGTRGRGWKIAAAAAAGLVGVVAVCAAPPWNSMLMARGFYKYALDPNLKARGHKDLHKRFLSDRDLVFYREGITTTVCVVDEGDGHIYLATNGKVDASSIQDMPTQVLLAQIPMHVAPKNDEVMIIGFASGTTVGSVLLHPLNRAVALEIEPAVVEASRFFNHVNNRPLDDPRLEVVNEDARNYLLVTDRRFDLIISEPSNPWMTIASNLFTRDFYEIARRRLNPGGCYCQWLQLYALRLEDVRCIAATFRSVFPHAYVFYSKESVDLMLVGSADPFPIRVDELRRRMRPERVARDLDARVAVYDAEALLAHFMAGPQDLADFCEGSPLNTDDNARIEFATPKTMALNEGARIQETLLGYTRGLSAHIAGWGDTNAELAAFVLDVAVASQSYGEGVDALTKALARDAWSLAPDDEEIAPLARELMRD